MKRLLLILILLAIPAAAENYIVEFDQPPILDEAATRTYVDVNAELQMNFGRFETDLHNIVNVVKNYLPTYFEAADTEIIHDKYTLAFNGVSITIPKEAIKYIQQLPYVKKIYVDHEVKESVYNGNKLIGVDSFYKQDYNGEFCAISGRSCLDGSGITVAIIDSGIDYTHPDFGSCTQTQYMTGNCARIKNGVDYVNGDYDPFDDRGHGTGVAGILGADGAIKGVAPKVNIMPIKVLSNQGTGYESAVQAGIQYALDPNGDGYIDDRVDIIVLSLGSTNNDPTVSALTQSLINVKPYVTVVLAAGNHGPDAGSITCPACAEELIAVGSSGNNNTDAVLKSLHQFVFDDHTADLESIPLRNSGLQGDYSDAEYDLVDAGTTDLINDADYAGKIAVIKATGTFSSMGILLTKHAMALQTLERKGAKQVLIYSDDETIPEQMSVYFPLSIPAFVLADGDKLDFSQISKVRFSANINPFFVSYFSGRGPNALGVSRPDVLAPGHGVCTSQPDSTAFTSNPKCLDDKHRMMYGTSFSAPFVAGVAALMKQKEPDLNHDQIKAKLKSFAKPLAGYWSNDQGAGLLQMQNYLPKPAEDYCADDDDCGMSSGECVNFVSDDDCVCVLNECQKAKTIIYPTLSGPAEVQSVPNLLFWTPFEETLENEIGADLSSEDFGFTIGAYDSGSAVMLPKSKLIANEFIFPSDFTISLWVNTTSEDRFQFLVSNYQTEDPFKGLAFALIRGVPAFYLGCGEGIIAPKSKAVNNGNWHHLALSVDNKIVKVFRDGYLIKYSSLTCTPDMKINDNMYIGAVPGFPAYSFDGQMDDLRVYDYAMMETNSLIS